MHSDGEGRCGYYLLSPYPQAVSSCVKLFVVIFEFGSGLILGELEYESIFFAYAMMSVERPMGDCTFSIRLLSSLMALRACLSECLFPYRILADINACGRSSGKLAMPISAMSSSSRRSDLLMASTLGLSTRVGVELFEFAKQNSHIAFADLSASAGTMKSSTALRSI